MYDLALSCFSGSIQHYRTDGLDMVPAGVGLDKRFGSLSNGMFLCAGRNF